MTEPTKSMYTLMRDILRLIVSSMSNNEPAVPSKCVTAEALGVGQWMRLRTLRMMREGGLITCTIGDDRERECRHLAITLEGLEWLEWLEAKLSGKLDD